jgi:hypothetical protein
MSTNLKRVRADIGNLETKLTEAKQLAEIASEASDVADAKAQIESAEKLLEAARQKEAELMAASKPQAETKPVVAETKPVVAETTESPTELPELAITGEVDEPSIDLNELQLDDRQDGGNKADNGEKVTAKALASEAGSQAYTKIMRHLPDMVSQNVTQAVGRLPRDRRTRRWLVGSILVAALIMLVIVPVYGLFFGETSQGQASPTETDIAETLSEAMGGTLGVAQPGNSDGEDAATDEEPAPEEPAPEESATTEEEEAVDEGWAWYYY